MILRLVLFIAFWAIAWSLAATLIPSVKSLLQRPDRLRKWLAGTAVFATILAVMPIYG